MSSQKIAQKIHHMMTPDSFVWWVLLAISMLSLPTYILVMSYGVYETEIGNIMMLALCCTISIYLGVHIHEVFFSHKLRVNGFADSLPENMREEFLDNAPLDTKLIEYEKYLRKISSINEHTSMIGEGMGKHGGYHRSCNHISDTL